MKRSQKIMRVIFRLKNYFATCLELNKMDQTYSGAVALIAGEQFTMFCSK